MVAAVTGTLVTLPVTATAHADAPGSDPNAAPAGLGPDGATPGPGRRPAGSCAGGL